MKKFTFAGLRLCLAVVSVLAFQTLAHSQTVRRCGTMEADAERRQADPDLESTEQFEAWMSEAQQAGEGHKVIGGVYQIPVVFHVIHAGEAIGSGSNISQAALQSQIDVLNEDFRKMMGSNGYNTHADGADTEIEFCLAQRRPDGSAFAAGQPGVNRILYTSIGATAPPFTQAYVENNIKIWTYNGGTPTATRGWDPGKYLNIWICNLGQSLLGYAQFPTSPIGGMGSGSNPCASGGGAATDGVVFLYSSIGKSSVTGFPGPYNQGRTATHEIGHWLGLRHIWGDGDCTATDYCNDTPTADGYNYGCPTGQNSCVTAAPDYPDMVENYMDYTDDLCMNIFTNDQKSRMRTVLESSPMRLSLINSDACTPPNTNDASVTDVFNPKGDHCNGPITPSVQLRNRGSVALTSATISYKVDNGTATTFSWTGTLAAGASATVALPAFTPASLGVHTFKAYSTLPNGAADPSTIYDTSSISFVVSNGIMPNYSQTFETGTFPPDIKWTVDNPNNDCFEWVGASGISSAGVFNNSMAQLPFFGNSNTTQNENLVTPVFILPCNATAASLVFKVAYRRKTTGSTDRLIVEISQDCGATWTATGYDKSGTTLATNTGLVTGTYYPTVAADWRTETINLASYVTSTSKNIRFRFRGVSGNGNNIFIDDLVYSATTPGEINVVQSGNTILDGGSYNFGSVAAGNTINATFTVQNTGTTNLVLTPPVTVTGTGFALATTFGATTIAAGATTTFVLSFTPNAVGAFTGNVSFTTNDCDEGTYNFILNGTGIAVMPVADFSAVPTTVCLGSNVVFTNLSTDATSYSWNFGAAATPSTSTAANPTVVFNTAGTYPITLTATNTFGSDIETKTAYITVVGAATATLPITEGFASATFPPAGWSIVNVNGSTPTWARTTAAGLAPTTGNAMIFNNFNNTDSDDDEIRLTAATFAGLVSAQLAFDVAYAPYNTSTRVDGLQILVSTDCGVTYTSVYSKSGATLQTRTATTTAFVPTTAQWRNDVVNLTAYVGQPNVVIVFRNLSGNGNRLYIDNINITGVAGVSAPVASFTGTPAAVCAGQTVTYTSTSTNSPTSYSWSFPGGTPSTSTSATQVVTYNTAGTYNASLTATNAGGSNTATQTNYVTVTALPATPTITASGPLTFCAGGSVVLTSSATTGNLWSTGATTQTITVTTSGTYTVTRTTGGCTSAASLGTTVTVTPLPATPTVTASGPLSFCTGGSVVLTSSATTGNLWSTGATTQAITVTTSGTYTVTRTTGGCTSAASLGTIVTVTALPATPTITASGPLTFCAGGNVVLTSSATTGNLWSTGATTQTITVTTSGTYTVTRTTSGCTSASSAGTTVTVNPAPATPAITAGGPTSFCTGGNVVLTSSSGTGNLWSTGATTPSITVSASGSYTVSVTSGGCTSAASIATPVSVSALPATPAITAGGPTTFCSGGNVVLTSSSPSGNVWSTGETTPSVTVTAAGSYTVVNDAGGCSSPNSTAVTVSVTPAPAAPTITAGGPTAFCAGGSVVLTSSASTGNLWSNGASSQSITVSSSNTYTVSQTASGCSSPVSTGITVTASPAPVISAGIVTNPALCGTATGSIEVTGSGTGDLSWSGTSTGSQTAITLPATIPNLAAGSYSFVFTNNPGCVSNTLTQTLTDSGSLPTPTVSAGGPTTFCTGGNVVLTSSSVTGNTWSNGSTAPSITVSSSGVYSVAVSNGGCTSPSSPATTITVNPAPSVTLGAFEALCDYSGAITLTGGSPVGGTYSGNGVTGTQFDPAAAGSGTSTVTYFYTNSNGCSAIASSTISVEACLGISESGTSMISAFPNPSSGMLTVDAGDRLMESIVVFDHLGKLVFSSAVKASSSVIDLTAFADGVYTIKVITETGIEHIPVVVSK